MNQEIINDDQPAKRNRTGGGRAFHSRLEPFVEFIRQQRQQRKTWKEIATALSGEKDCAITAQGVHQFYRRHLKRQSRPHWENEAAMEQPTTVKPPAPPQTPAQAETTTNPYQFNNLDI
jgi:hypothetical protein